MTPLIRKPSLLLAFLALGSCNAHHPDKAKTADLEKTANDESDYSDLPVDPDYAHAPDSAREAWLDRKFGMRIHWGVYSQLGLDASWPTYQASDEFRQIYGTLWQVFNPVRFNADEWAALAEDAGMKYFVFTAKHHDGFSMFDTKTTVNAKIRRPEGRVKSIGHIADTTMHYSIMETQYKEDLVKKIIDAFRKRKMGIGLYYSNTDWNDSNQRFEKNNFYYDSTYTLAAHPEGYRAAIDRQTQQLRELCNNYGPIDQIDFDHALPRSLWNETVKMIKMVRSLQPNALFRQRGLGRYGDFQTPEHWLPESPDDPRLSMPWQAIENYGSRWAWQPNDTYKGREWILESLIDCASKGGNFMVGISPTPTGEFDQRTKDDLHWVGQWLKVNGEAIYATRGMFTKDPEYKFTRNKSKTIVYAIHKGWPGPGQVTIKNIQARPGSAITLLGSDARIAWTQKGPDLVIDTPKDKPHCEHSFVFKIYIQ